MFFGVRMITRLLALLMVCSAGYADDQSPQSTPREDAWQALHAGLNDSKAAKRKEAVQALSLISGNRTAQRLAVKALSDENSSVRTSAAITLGQLHANSAIPALKAALADKEISVVLAATYSLFLLKDKTAYDVYYSILMGEKKTGQGLIQSQLDRLKDPKKMAELGVQQGLGFVPFGGVGFEAYRQISKRNAAPVRAAAARLLAHDPNPMSADALVQAAVADDSENVRLAALDALAERGDKSCVEHLMKNLQDEKSVIRYRTAAAILHLTTPEPSKKPRKIPGTQSPRSELLERERPASGEDQADTSGP